MHPLDLDRLRSVRSYPAISVLFSPTVPGHRLAPADTVRLHQLIGQVERRLGAELPPERVEDLVVELSALVTRVSARPASPGLGLFVSDPLTMAVASPAPVGERVAIDPTFSLRELDQAVDRAPRYRVLVLAGARSRIFEGLGPTLWPATAPSPPPDPAPGARRRQRGHHFGVEVSALREVSRRRLMTGLDEVLAGMARKDPLPLVVVGSARDAALFQELSTQGPSVIGTVCGLHGRANPARLLRLVQPVVDAHLREERDRALARLQEASEPRRAGGIDAAWTLAHDGWVEMLCVEEGFAYPARVEGSCLAPAADPEHPEVLDDAVDETMAAVTARGGTTVVVPDGSLSAHGRMAALLRPGAPGRPQARCR